MFSRSSETPPVAGREYFIHLGLHKTATTALQEFLQKNTQKLLANDVRYIPLQRMRAEVTPLFCHADKAKRDRLFDLFHRFPNGKVLLSDENILGNPGDIASGVLYPFAKNRILSFCEGAGNCPVTLFLTLREPAAFITSIYCEYIRHNEFISFDEYIALFDIQGFSYGRVFGWLRKLPRNVRVLVTPFEHAAGGGIETVVKRISEAVFAPNTDLDFELFPKRKSRSSYSLEEIDLAAEIARRAGPRMAQVFLNALDARDKRFGTTKFSPLSKDLEGRLEERYIKELVDFS